MRVFFYLGVKAVRRGGPFFFVGDLKELLTTNFSLIIGALIDMFVSVKLINRINESETLQRNF